MTIHKEEDQKSVKKFPPFKSELETKPRDIIIINNNYHYYKCERYWRSISHFYKTKMFDSEKWTQMQQQKGFHKINNYSYFHHNIVHKDMILWGSVLDTIMEL